MSRELTAALLAYIRAEETRLRAEIQRSEEGVDTLPDPTKRYVLGQMDRAQGALLGLWSVQSYLRKIGDVSLPPEEQCSMETCLDRLEDLVRHRTDLINRSRTSLASVPDSERKRLELAKAEGMDMMLSIFCGAIEAEREDLKKEVR